MSIEKRLKNSTFNLRITKEDAEFIKTTCEDNGLKQVQLIEALLHNFKDLPLTKRKFIIMEYLTRDVSANNELRRQFPKAAESISKKLKKT